MSENCTHDCSSCSENCSSRDKKSFLEPLNEMSSVKKVIAVASGKGGVGKSTVTSLLAVAMSKRGYKVAVLDADITGPSIPKSFGITSQAEAAENFMLPALSKGNIKIISANMLLETEETPIIWRGPVIAGAVKQFWTDVLWGEVDFMFVDMPPGTGDVPLTVFQSLPIDGAVVVTTPQDLVKTVVAKAVNMAKQMEIPVIGLVENMSYVLCPDCGKRIDIFGKSKFEENASKYGIAPLAQMPVNGNFASLCDSGNIEDADTECIERAADAIEKLL